MATRTSASSSNAFAVTCSHINLVALVWIGFGFTEENSIRNSCYLIQPQLDLWNFVLWLFECRHTTITKIYQLQAKCLIVVKDYIEEIGEVICLKYLCDDDNTTTNVTLVRPNRASLMRRKDTSTRLLVLLPWCLSLSSYLVQWAHISLLPSC